MIIGIGTDLVDIRRIERLSARFGTRFEKRLCGVDELRKIHQRGMPGTERYVAALAKRYAAKEACAKALGTGIGAHASLQDIVVTHEKNGRPGIQLQGPAALFALSLVPDGGMFRADVSLSDEYPYVQAFVVLSA